MSAGLNYLTLSCMLSRWTLSHCCLWRSRCLDTSTTIQTVLTAIGQDHDQLRVHDMLLVTIIKDCRQGKPACQRGVRAEAHGDPAREDLYSMPMGVKPSLPDATHFYRAMQSRFVAYLYGKRCLFPAQQ